MCACCGGSNFTNRPKSGIRRDPWIILRTHPWNHNMTQDSQTALSSCMLPDVHHPTEIIPQKIAIINQLYKYVASPSHQASSLPHTVPPPPHSAPLPTGPCDNRQKEISAAPAEFPVTRTHTHSLNAFATSEADTTYWVESDTVRYSERCTYSASTSRVSEWERERDWLSVIRTHPETATTGEPA